MAGNLILLDNQLAATSPAYAMGLTANVTGVYFDGAYFWATDADTVYQLDLSESGSLFVVYSFSLAGVSAGLTSLDGITGDGVDLYVAYHETISDGGFPPLFTTNAKVIKVDKGGNVLSTPVSVSSLLFNGSQFQDITYDGVHLYTMHFVVSGTAAATIAQRDVQNGSVVAAPVVRVRARGIDFEGVDHLFVGGTDGANPARKLNRAAEVVFSGASLGFTATGCCVLHNPFSKNARLWNYGHLAVCYN